MRIVTDMGYVFRVSERKYRQLLRAIATGQTWDLANYGTRIGDRFHNVTDVTAEEAQDELNDLKAERKGGAA